MRNLRANRDRLWDSLMEMAAFGATPKGGCRRLALSDEDKQGRDRFVEWCEAAGCSVTVDRMGNIFARRPGRDASRPPVVAGSHLDTQPHGGKFDGVFGVLAGLEVIRTLNDHAIETQAPVEVAVWTNEEGARFAPAMIASGVFAGAFDLDYALACADPDGRTMGEELARIGYAGEAECGGRPFAAFFEAHIEQGPILEREGETIGVVTGVQGIRWYDVAVSGQDAHAGPTPMEMRRDALVGAARMIDAVNRIGHAHLPDACATVGVVDVSPKSRNTIPGEVTFSVDMRHPDAEVLAGMDRALRAQCAEIAANAGLGAAVEEIWYSPPVAFDPACVDAVRAAADALGYGHRDIVSGAGHDAVYVSRVAPTGMVFVPCAGGLSHNEEESADAGDLAAGCSVLLNAMLDRAGVVSH
ncbi:MAG: Zn-dependent hydrolase [Alphaproteobacteria bacterium]